MSLGHTPPKTESRDAISLHAHFEFWQGEESLRGR
jgi:hypothetical protein